MTRLKITFLIPSLFFTAIVFAQEVSYRELLRLNGENINQVSQGMSEAEVREIMGSYTSEVRDGEISNPWLTEQAGDTLILHYLVKRNPPFVPLMENQASPVILVNGAVSAIGRTYLVAARNAAAGNAQPAESSGSSNASLSERLKTLDDLLESGAIDQATYDRQKERILNSI